MSLIKNRGTKPEIVVRRTLYELGFRYRLHVKNLPGCPDIVFRSRKKAIFVHGCFWHQHGCRQYRMPRSKLDFWQLKLTGNKRRDRRSRVALRKLGWRTMVVWECNLRFRTCLKTRLQKFLEMPQ